MKQTLIRFHFNTERKIIYITFFSETSLFFKLISLVSIQFSEFYLFYFKLNIFIFFLLFLFYILLSIFLNKYRITDLNRWKKERPIPVCLNQTLSTIYWLEVKNEKSVWDNFILQKHIDGGRRQNWILQLSRKINWI